ncbi:hypothetical protein [Lichenihabitans psoromatis]|uniref:hypothetical protein n=1 Tax=Lichenihabitans psoromatis TaxID=2528642 RepID=UPI0010369296|nr:hypothetical protein [Lichenihabitans psoromatis]
MLNLLISHGLSNIPKAFLAPILAQQPAQQAQALIGYPMLLSALTRAERSGSLAAERQKVLQRLQG